MRKLKKIDNIKFKRFWCIVWDDYYPSGRLRSVHASFDTMEEAELHLLKLTDRDYYEMYDSKTGNYYQLEEES